MIVRILYLAIIAILVRLIWRGLVQRVPGVPEERLRTEYRGLMVRDPVCGLHLPESRAIVSVDAGETLHFCSETCRARYVPSVQARAR